MTESNTKQSNKPVAGKRSVRWAVRLLLLLAAMVVAFLPTLGRILAPIDVATLSSPVAAVVTFLSWLGSTRLPVVIPALSPLVTIAAIIATLTVTATMWIGITVALVAVVRRRWFCRWVCPTGTCADLVGRPAFFLGRRCPRVFSVGPSIAWLTVGGAIFGYPFLLWLDPLAMFSGAFGIVHGGTSSAGWWSALGMAGLLALSVVWPGLWCLRLCPLGAVQDGLAFCGSTIRRTVRLPGSDQVLTNKEGLTRRTVLGVIASVGAAAAGVTVASVTRSGRASGTRPLRPPGALDEGRFLGVCIRCGNCLRACPTDIIRLDLGDHGIAGLLTPRLDFRDDYCREDCTRCTDVCPSGALTSLTIEQKPQALIGFPRVDMDVCLLGDDRDCAVCRNWCPYEAISLVFDEEEYTLTPQIDPAKCPGCGACEMACPTAPIKAIVVESQ